MGINHQNRPTPMVVIVWMIGKEVYSKPTAVVSAVFVVCDHVVIQNQLLLW